MPTLALILAVLGWGTDVLLDKLAVRTMSPAAIAFVYGALEVVLLPCWYLAFRREIQFSEFTGAGVGWASAASLVGLATYFAYVYALRHLPASTVAGYGLASTAVAVVLCRVFLGEEIGAWKAIGIGLMIAGAWVLGR